MRRPAGEPLHAGYRRADESAPRAATDFTRGTVIRPASELKPPIIVIGTNRSGTSMLARHLGAAPGLCCWYEPATVWRIGHAYRSTEVAEAHDARPWVVRRIRRAFLQYQQANDGRRVVEKTPNNVLRVPFVHAVLPEAKIVHIYRDGRAQLRSQLEQFETFEGYGIMGRHVRRHALQRLRETPWWEWPAYLPRALDGMVRNYVTHKPIGWYGIRYPGWKADRSTLTGPQIAARQWVVSIETALRDLAELPDDAWINLRYEEVVTDPRKWFGLILDFCGIERDEAYLDRLAGTVHADSVHRWREELEPGELEAAMPVLEPTLRELGYDTA